MADKNSDYNKKHINLNDFLPGANKGDLLESLNVNLFNRYLTKDEFDRIVGLIGDIDPNDSINKPITERTPFRQNNQLQPIITQQIGSANHYMSFEDFLTRIGRTGVNTEKFNEWGNALQFNWIPPIDLDKIVNYRDYYWNSISNPNHTIPQYITIKNKKNWATARYVQSLKTAVDISDTVTLLGYDAPTQMLYLSGDQTSDYTVGNHLILSDNEGNIQLISVASVSYNLGLGRTEIVTNESFDMAHDPMTVYLSQLELPILSTGATTISVSGNLSNLLINQYVIGVNATPFELLEVESSTFDVVNNVTIIVTKTDVPSGVTKLSLYPVISLMQAEMELYVNQSLSFPAGTWENDWIGTLLWANNVEVTTGTFGQTTQGSNTLLDTTRDFTVYDIEENDTLHILLGSTNTGNYTINSVTPTEIITNEAQFFSASNINYRILKDFSLELISTPPLVPVIDDVWYNSGNDSLYQYDGSTWNIVYKGVSLLNNLIRERTVSGYTNVNDWSDDNEWVHRSTIREFTGMIRAQMPIIEYFPFVELSETSYSSKVWRYRRNSTISYSDVNTAIEPKMIELMDFTYTGTEFTFDSPTTISFDQKFGNFAGELVPGDEIRLQGFSLNDGIYTVASVDYVQPALGERFISVIELTTPLYDTADQPLGATILPMLTSMGDPFMGLAEKHWEFGGIANIEASSVLPTKNPMLDINVMQGSDSQYEYFVGLTSQTYSSFVGTIIEPEFYFHPSLHDLVLYDDYQEGDIRVYINGIRIYGAFEDIGSNVNPDYVGGIKFVNNFVLGANDVVRVELGEYSINDIGKRAIVVNTAVGDELYNLTTVRKIEQRKSDSNQYPYFALRDIYGDRLNIATSIFKFKESETAEVNPNVLKRIVMDGTDYTFTQELKDHDTGRLYCYYDYERVGDELQTIWKHGTHSEQYVPVKIDGQWELPNQWYYNISHENYSEIKLTELFRHFKSIIDSQEQPGLFNRTSGLFWLDDSINYGLGGTIKEHNDGFDTLASSVFVDNGNPLSVINFARNQYDAQVEYLKEHLYLSTDTLFAPDDSITSVADLQASIIEKLINALENNEKYDQWFGDSTSFSAAEQLGVRNWIATIPQFGLSPRYTPYLVNDSAMNILQVRCHDGHLTDVRFEIGLKEQFLRKIAGTSTATYPPTGTPEDGAYSIENVTQVIGGKQRVVERNLYRYSETLGQWEPIDVNAIFAATILEVEQRLYSILDDTSDVENFEPIYDMSVIESSPDYNRLMALQFETYTSDEEIDNPLLNVNTFRQNDPFTWNYYHSTIATDPVVGGSTAYAPRGSWQALYYTVYGTSYPNIEPWILQGYANKPSWWDGQYSDTTGTRKWLPVMWDNIFNGTIPTIGTAPDGTPGTGTAGQITELFSYLPVNTGLVDTDDGYQPDDILPPYWNTINTSTPRIRGLFDPNEGEFVVTPQLNFEFGQMGFVEWEWMTSTSYLYDKLIVAYQIDPMRFLHQTYGIDYQIVSCLQISKETEKVFSHNDVNFHGDFNNDTRTSYTYHGLNQWYVHYNRYSGYDGVASEFRSLWREWRTKLSYLVGAFLDTPSFSISNALFDITTKDYEIAVKKTKAIDDKWLTSLTGTVISIPSPYSRLRDQGIGWTVEFTNNAPVTVPLEYHPVQNYSVQLNSSTSTFKTYSYVLKSADITPAREYQTIEYNTPVALSFSTGLTVGVNYPIEIILDNDGSPLSATIDGSDAQTFGDLITLINDDVLGARGSLVIENGNLVLYSNNNTIMSSVNITNDAVFAATDGFVQVLPSEPTANEFMKSFRIDGNFQNTFEEVTQIVITDSTYFNGTYTIDRVFYDANRLETVIFVKEDVTLPPVGAIVYDGTIEPNNAKTLPVEWTTGTSVLFNSTGYPPPGIDDEIPYYIIRINDREFRIAETKDGAEKGVYLTNLGQATGELFVGKLNSTFTAMGGEKTQYNWRIHEIDYRYVESVARLSISGIQQMVDFLVGYDAKTQTDGFRYKNPNGDNLDPETGRINDWQTVMEKFINWMFALRNFQQETTLSYRVNANSTNDTFAMVSGSVPNWANGTQVVLIANDGVELPNEFNSPLSSIIPYYVVRLADSSNEFRLAATSFDAERGNYIPFSDNGTGSFSVQVYKPLIEFPAYELNPFKSNVWINHEFGILSNVLDEDFIDPLYAPRLYDNNLIRLTTADVLIFREDGESKIALTGDLIDKNTASTARGGSSRHMSGMHLFLDGYEHIISFQDYSVDNTLIYDSFLGLNTPRFYVEFDRQQNFTLRPNVGGFYLQGDSLVQNFESIVNDMRYYYDSKTAPEGRITTDLVRKSLGYDGPKEYMSDLNINAKTQFQFWQGMIQNKGTNKAVTAFVNQDTFDTAEVDEFWAYKLAEFGDSRGKEYIEMKLFPDDVVGNDLRIEFIAPENAPLDSTFEGVALTDMERWWDQPDQIEAMEPAQTFFFDAKISRVITDINDNVTVVSGRILYLFDEIVDSVIIHYFDPITEQNKLLTEHIDYEFLNSKIIQFTTDPATLPPLSISIITYDYDSQNPAKIIDKDAGIVITELPIWHPANGHYYNHAYYPVDLRRPTDPAIYTNTLDGQLTGNASWKNNHVGTVWFDNSIEQYIPYWDKQIFPDINDRIEKWGKLADWADINLYQWTRTTVHPDDYDELVTRQEFNTALMDSEKYTGSVYRLLYEDVNYGNEDGLLPYWVELKDVHHDFTAGLIPDSLYEALGGKTVIIYINGESHGSFEFEDSDAVRVYFSSMPFGTQCHTKIERHTPTREELDNGQYQYFTPHTVEKRFDSKSATTYNVYYYWVKDKKEPISPVKTSVTLFTAKKQLTDMTAPYIILQGVRTPDFGYGLIFGHVFDEFQFNLPYRYSQFVAKGLHGTVKGRNRYVMRFTRDFTLRDVLDENSLSPKNLHIEWKLFREKQLEKIDRYLWNKVTEALIGYKLSNNTTINFNQAIPSLDRVLFDRLQSADTQYGLGVEQVFTNKDLSRDTILSVLTNPNQEFEYIVIEEFLGRHDFLTVEDIVSAMDEIYMNFSTNEVNMIFFAVLHDAMSLKQEHKEIFKTSWVALQISQIVAEPIAIPYDELRLVPGDPCDAPPPSPSPTPSPTPTPAVSLSATPAPTLTPTPTPTVTPTPSPVIDCGTGELDRITEDAEGRLTEEGECRIIEGIPPAEDIWDVLFVEASEGG